MIVITDNERILGIGDRGRRYGDPGGKAGALHRGGGHPPLVVPADFARRRHRQHRVARQPDLPRLPRSPGFAASPSWDLVAEVVEAVRTVFPGALLQWEDFGNSTSFRHLETYREVLPSFNDDIQGTAAMVVAGLHSAMRLLGGRLRDQRVVVAGAGSAGIGIVRQLRAAMIDDGLSETEARTRILVTDSKGLVVAGQEQGNEFKSEIATDPAFIAAWDLSGPIDLSTVIAKHRPSLLVGVTGQPDTFTREMIETMTSIHEQPIVMPLSNPTVFAEATPADILKWSRERP